MTAEVSPRTLVEAFLPLRGSAPLAEIYDTANLAGIADQPVRLAIRRMIAAGDLVQMGRGRSGSLTLTQAGRQRLERDQRSLDVAFAQDAGEVQWDGRWRLIAVSTSERERPVRDMLRRKLHDLGAVAISTGLYLSPHDLVGELPEDMGPYLSIATTDDLTVRERSDPKIIAEDLWPSRPVLDAYSTLDDALRRDEAERDVPAVVRMLRLAEALERAIREDPLLPPELRSSPWSPSRTRIQWVDRWEALAQCSQVHLYQR